ncbi:MAG: hypothetical protein HOH04_01860 [Rhodospirillaceae bacterium]|jgi:HPr kinase/phosphorylase|nr:hypothetical protein [Rhodospirillaceae bacterium]
MTPQISDQIHATCIAIDGQGVLLRGASASGKSDLALRLIDAGAELVADDRVDLQSSDGILRAAAPAQLTGLLEVRGIGILRFAASQDAPVAVICDLSPFKEIERLPVERHVDLLNVKIPAFSIDPFEPSAMNKVQLALALSNGSIMRGDDTT